MQNTNAPRRDRRLASELPNCYDRRTAADRRTKKSEESFTQKLAADHIFNFFGCAGHPS